MKKLFQSIAISLLFSFNTFAQLSFQTTTLPVGIKPTSVSVGDLNGDGFNDLAVTNWNSGGIGTISVYTGTGNGGFGTEKIYSTGLGPQSLVIADVNADNKLDIVVANSGSKSISVLTNTGSGILSDAVNFPTGIPNAGPVSIATADFNLDGFTDICVANYSVTGTITVFSNNGFGDFSNKTIYNVGSIPFCITTGDVNNDGKIDIVVANSASNNVGVLTNTGNGFSSQKTYATGSNPSGVSLGDLNNDGFLDMAVINNFSNTVGVYLNTNTGTFTNQVIHSIGSYPASVAISDINGDGFNDLAVVNRGSNNLQILTNSGVATFSNLTTFPAGTYAFNIGIADLNIDGKPDLISTNMNTDNISIFFNKTVFPINKFKNGIWINDYPTPSQDILVNSDLTLSSDLGVSNATISSGITLTVPTGYVFTLSGTLTNNGTIVVEDGASLVQASGSSLAGSGTYIIKRNGTSNSTQYNYYSSPINNGTTAMLGGTSGYQYQYAENSRAASDYSTGWQSASGSLSLGKGYTSLGSGSINFTGTINNGNISTPVTYTNIANNITADGWNLVGNPYPSSIDISSFLSANSSVLYTSGVYFWNGTNYVTFNSGSIPSCQGFFISAKTNGNVSFTNSLRTKTKTSLYRVAAKTVLKLSLTNPNGQKDITQIEFTSDGSDSFNPNEDALKLKGNTVLQLYSRARNSVYDLAINTKSNLYLDTTVQLVYDGAVSGTYQLSLDEATNVPDKIWVQDQTTNTVSELKKGTSYTFTGGNTSANQRLVLKLSGARTEILTSNALPSIETKEISIQQKGKDFEIEGNGKLQAQLLDLQGRNLAQTLGNNKLLFSVGMLPAGVYILKINDELGIKTVKVLIF
jgi:hypothetical protein